MKKILSAIIAAAMLISMTAVPVLAEDDLILHYDFSDAEVTDVSGNGNDGKIEGENPSADIENGMIHLEDNTYISMPEGILSDEDTVTVAINLMPEIEKANMFTWNFGNSSTEGYMFLNTARGDGKLRFGITMSSYGDEEELVCDDYISSGTWSNVVVVIDGENSKLYRDGELTAENSLTLKPSDLGETTQNYIGKSPYSADKYFKGYIDDFRIYDRALTAEEVKSLSDEYQAGMADYLIEKDLESIELPSETKSHLVLKDYGENTGKDIVWQSDNESVIKPDGTVSRQSEDTDVVLTANLSYGGKLEAKAFKVKVTAEDETEEPAEENLYLVASFGNGSVLYYVSRDGENYSALENSAVFRAAAENPELIKGSDGFFYITDGGKAVSKSADLITWISADEAVSGDAESSQYMQGSLVMLTEEQMDKVIAALGTGTEFDEAEMRTVKILPNEESPFGEFEGWGTSLCWWANYMGYSEVLTDKAAKAVFNLDEGLGLNIARYNIGGGDDPTHNHITRLDSAVPGYMNADGTYDWDADVNQLNVLKAAVREGADIVEAFSNSAPYFMTISGCSSGAEDPSEDNLMPDKNEEFADYLTTVVKHLEDVEGIDIDSISPMNEPQTSYWGANSPKQEGMHVEAGESQSKMIEALADSIVEKGIDAIISATEETSIDTAITSFNALSDEAKDAVTRINTHTYSGSKRTELMETASAAGKGLWMSEVDGTFTAGTNARYMSAALGLAHRFNIDVNQMKPTAWVLWQALDSHKKSGSIYENNSSDDRTTGFWGIAFADHDREEITLTKKYYGFGQYTRYIREGDTIISNSDDGNTLAAYNKDSGKIVIVSSNTTAKTQPVTYDLSDFAETGANVRRIRTSVNESWQELEMLSLSGKSLETELAPNSITTFVIEKDMEYTVPELTGDTVILGYDAAGILRSASACTPEQAGAEITLKGVPQSGSVKVWKKEDLKND
ncbi:MAG: hypothetical protein LIO59_06680 [Oscillospiraceae bacterium]|nr:hypothetical protein [Oscillospiraceae bacterium]